MHAIQHSILSIRTVPVAIYTRVSTHHQVGGRFDSCESQAAICRDFISRHVDDSWFEVACYTDPAFSGGTMNRPGIRALKQQIAAGGIKVVLIYKLERLMRCTEEWGPFRAFLKQHGCALVTTSEGLCSDSPSDRLKNHLLISVAEYERLNTKEKVKQKMLELAKRGFWNCGQVPFGYTYDTKARMLLPCFIEAPIVKQVYSEAAQLIPVPDIVIGLNDGGLRTRVRVICNRAGEERTIGGKLFRDDMLRNLVRNPIYAGRVRFNKREFAGKHIPLVDADLWERANAAVEQRPAPATRRRTGDKHFHLLKGLVHCGCCGRPMAPNSSGHRAVTGKPYRYYACGYRKDPDTTPCVVRHVSADALEAVIFEFIGMCARHPDVLDEAVKACSNYTATGRESIARRLERAKNAISVINEQIECCVEVISSRRAEILSDELLAKIAGLKHAKPGLLVEHEQLRQELLRHDTRIVDTNLVRKAMDHVQETLATLSHDEQRNIVALVVERLEVHPAPLPARSTRSYRRHFELRLTMRLARLLDGMADKLVVKPTPTRSHPRCGRAMVMKIRFKLPSAGTAGPIVMLTPMRHEIPKPARHNQAPIRQEPFRHNPMLRALGWQRTLAADSTLSRVSLAKMEKVTPGTITHHFKLIDLHPTIQTHLTNLKTSDELRRFSLNKMKALAEFPLDEQMLRFQNLTAFAADNN